MAQQHTATEVDIRQLFNTKVYDRNSQEFAKVANVWVDKDEHPQLLGILMQDNENHIIPAQGAELSSRGDKVRLAYDMDTVNASPTCDPTKDLRDEDERKVYDFFQGKDPNLINPYASSNDNQVGVYDQAREYGQAQGDNQTEGKDISLSEEELAVGKREVEEGSVRLRKVVRTETVEQPVDLRHEEIVIDRGPGSGKEVPLESIGEEEYYIPLHHEETVIQKQAHERERIHVGKRVNTEHEVVSEKLRREELKDSERQS